MTDQFRIHALYVIAILLAIIVGMISVEWSQIPGLADLISFGLTVSSLLLALVAIVHAFISNTENNANAAKLQLAVTQVTESAESIREATQALNTQVSALPEIISSVGHHVDRAASLMAETRNRIEAPAAKQGSDPDPSEELVDRFLQSSSIAGLFILYALKVAFERGRPLDIVLLASRTTVSDSSYLYGYLIAAAAVGVVDFEGEEAGIIAKSLHPRISATIEQNYLATVDNMATGADHRRNLLTSLGEVAVMLTEGPIPQPAPASPAS